MPPGIVDDIIRKLETRVSDSVNVLNAILQMPDIKPKMILFDTFQMLTEDSIDIKQNWENMCEVDIEEVKCQVKNFKKWLLILQSSYRANEVFKFTV